VFHRISRIWRHLLMLKRSGRGHDPKGAAETSQGELAIECPACPHPHRNLPNGWEENASKKYVIQPPLCQHLLNMCVRYLYTQFLALDGNFKLRLKERGINDPELAPGWAYFVEEEKYQAFLKDYMDQPEVL